MSQSSRISLVVPPHKAIRYAFPQLSMKAGSMDFSDKQAVKELKAQLVEFGELLEEHASLENEFILKPLEQRAPGSTDHDLEDHENLEEMQERLLAKLDAILAPDVSPADANRMGYEFYQNLSELHAAHLEHMLEEERVTQVLMWEHFSDEEIKQLHGAIISHIPPDKMLAWVQYLVPAMTFTERTELLGGMKANAPAPFFEQVMVRAGKALPAQSFKELESVLLQTA